MFLSSTGIDLLWIPEAILLGCAMAMDAFSVSITNGLAEPNMKKRKLILIALVFGLFQGIMPVIGYFIGSIFQKLIEIFVPIIGFLVLAYLGINMIVGAFKKKEDEVKPMVGAKAILLQGIATSIDALSVGFVYTNSPTHEALLTFLIIGVITFGLCTLAVWIGKKFGEKFSNKAEILGGVILLCLAIKFLVEFLIAIF